MPLSHDVLVCPLRRQRIRGNWRQNSWVTANSAHNTEFRGGTRLVPLRSPSASLTTSCVSLSWAGFHISYLSAILVRGLILHTEFFYMDGFRSLPAEDSLTHLCGIDPVSVALGEAKATIVPQHEFGLLNGQGDVECPSESTQYDVYGLPERRIRDRPNRY